jgi:signal transduction histidine kinase
MLQNLPIRSKLVAILVVPLVVLTALTAVQIRSNITRGNQAERVNRLARFATGLSDFVHQLQRERGLSAGYVAGGAGYGSMIAQRVWVTQDLRDFGADAAALDLGGFDPRLGQQLRSVQAQLARLSAQRRAVETRRATSVDATLGYFSGVIASLLDIEGQIAGQTQDSGVLRNASAFIALARAKEAASRERDLVDAVLLAGRFGQRQYEQLVTVIGAADTWASQFQSSATAPQRAFYARTVVGPDIERAKKDRETILQQGPGGAIGADLSGGTGATGKQLARANAKNWYFVTTAKVDLLRQVEASLAADLTAASAASQASASRQAVVSSVVLLLALLVTVAVSLVIARSMVRPLRRLRRTAIDVAEQRLPGVVERLQGGERVDVAAETAPVAIASRDEIGQVAEAFNSVHRVAVAVATEQAALRKSVADTFLNLARRSQALIHRQLKLIDRLERKTTDPDELDELFQLDHLATRMRRNAEDLIVLSGAAPSRRWGRPVPLNDVVRGAIAEVEDYTRVHLLPVAGVSLVGQAVGDVIHLLAELIENATSFSPPHTKVQVAGQQAATGHVVEIEDRGIGMSDAELVEANERLTRRPTIDLALSQRLGLFVVARLAEHHGIKVQLRHSWYGGVTALVWLPEALIAQDPAGGAPVAETIGAGQRAALAAPAGEEPHGAPAPIFEAARSDWFAGAELVHLPLRRHGAEAATHGRAPVDDPAAGGRDQAPPTPPPEPAGDRGPAGDLPPPERPGQPAPARPADSPAPATAETTGAGLPRRVPQASLAPGIVATGQRPAAQQGPPPAPPAGAQRRTPNDVRALLSSYRSSVERGRHEASTDGLGPSGGDDDQAE